MKKISLISMLKDRRGATAIIVAVVILFVGIGIIAFAIEFGYRHVVQNELQDAADAGALAGARALYYENGAQVNDDGGGAYWSASANQIAYDTAAVENKSSGGAVEVNWTSGNTGDVQRGHWSFTNRRFDPDDSIAAINLGSYTKAELDIDTDVSGNKLHFINAVKVVTRRQANPMKTFFAKIFGWGSFTLKAEAVAYRGFTGSILPGEVDIPIAICAQSIWEDLDGDGEIDDDEPLSCNYGRMLNSGRGGGSANDHNTAGWTNFISPCVTANPSNMRPLLQGCSGNPDEIPLHAFIGTTGGVDDSIITHPSQPNLMDCWKSAWYDSDGNGEDDTPIDGPDADDLPEHPWTVKLPVVDCPGNNVANCSEVLGSIEVDIVWILEKENDIDNDAPYQMYHTDHTTLWSNSDPSGAVRWDDFVTTFNLQTVDSDPPGSIELATVANDGFKKKSVYFLPNCLFATPAGGTGGQIPSSLAKIPKLVNIPLADTIN